MEMKGKIAFIGKQRSETYNNKEYFKQKLLLEIPGYQEKVKTIPFEIGAKLQDRMDEYQVGMEVVVHYDFNGNPYDNAKTGERDAFLSLQTWRIDKELVGAPAPQPAQNYTQAPQPPYTPQAQHQQTGGSADDLPF